MTHLNVRAWFKCCVGKIFVSRPPARSGECVLPHPGVHRVDLRCVGINLTVSEKLLQQCRKAKGAQVPERDSFAPHSGARFRSRDLCVSRSQKRKTTLTRFERKDEVVFCVKLYSWLARFSRFFQTCQYMSVHVLQKFTLQQTCQLNQGTASFKSAQSQTKFFSVKSSLEAASRHVPRGSSTGL